MAVEGQAPSQLPPGPLPANQGLIAAGLAQQLHLLAGGPAATPGKGFGPLSQQVGNHLDRRWQPCVHSALDFLRVLGQITGPCIEQDGWG